MVPHQRNRHNTTSRWRHPPPQEEAHAKRRTPSRSSRLRPHNLESDYRLKVVTIVVPPVRERREDIPALVESFIADFNRRNGDKIRSIEPQAMRWLTELAWPGNVRELKNAVESAAMLATSETIGLEEFEPTTVAHRPATTPTRASTPSSAAIPPDSIVVSAKATLADIERTVISEHMKRAATKVAAARTLGIGLRTLYSKAKRYRIGAKA